MGSYLSTPVKVKHSEDDKNYRLIYGASCMQGWRVSQEDARNNILNFDDGISLFAVYDGHGGSEVAEYCALHLPNYIKQTKEYAAKNYTQALISSFLEFDATLTDSSVMNVLKSLADSDISKENDQTGTDASTDDSVDGTNRMIIKNALFDTIRSLQKKDETLDLKEKTENAVSTDLCENKSTNKLDADREPSTSGLGSKSRKSTRPKRSSAYLREGEGTSSKLIDDDGVNNNKENHVVADLKTNSSGSSTPTPAVNGALNSCANDAEVVTEHSVSERKDVSTSDKEENSGIVISDSLDTQSPTKDKGKGKAVSGPAVLSPNKKKTVSVDGLLALDDEVIYNTFKSESCLFSEESDSDDESFEVSNIDFNDSRISNEDSDDESENSDVKNDDVNVDSAEAENDTTNETKEEEDNEEVEETDSDESDDEEYEYEDIDDEEDDDDDDDDYCGDDDILSDFPVGGYKPGYNSGCTAVVALITEDCVYVANAGDSRCVASKAGVPLDLSTDHKPEDKIERLRIKRAGGRVTDGRVNNGLNLSRAIGDHHYKLNENLSSAEQMITANPDISTCEITPDLEFIVLACDGIWNSMTSQEVVNFVKTRMSKNMELSKICEEMFENCLAPNTLGDGTGCDNMTCIIVQFLPYKKVSGKKSIDSDDEDSNCRASKRQKTDDNRGVVENEADDGIVDPQDKTSSSKDDIVSGNDG